jgi:hypothetical protein
VGGRLKKLRILARAQKPEVEGRLRGHGVLKILARVCPTKSVNNSLNNFRQRRKR